MKALGNDSSKLVVLTAQMVNLFQNGEKVKMSKRTGKAVTMEDLMDEVGVDAIRYFLIMRSMDSHLILIWILRFRHQMKILYFMYSTHTLKSLGAAAPCASLLAISSPRTLPTANLLRSSPSVRR